MGLFDNIGPRTEKMTPALALGGTLVFVSAAEGEVDEDAIATLARTLRSEALFQASVRHASRHNFADFLEDARHVLDEAQRVCVFLNAVDLAMRRGALGSAEEAKLRKIMEVFELSEESMRPAVEALIAKNRIASLGI